ncbi:MAG: adenylate kinase [Anaerolineae bacterium]
MNIILLGAPGSGKGTQAEHLQAELGLIHISSGALFREHLNHKTELGLLAQAYMQRGEFVPDDITLAIVRQRLQRPDVDQGVIFDGFPRSLAQAQALTEMMADLGRRLDGVLYIEVPDATLVDRLAGRWICRECQAPFHRIYQPFQTCPDHKCAGEYLHQRDDDQPATVRARLATFHAQTAPLIDTYRRVGLLVTVPGAGAVDEVKRATLEAAQGLMH